MNNKFLDIRGLYKTHMDELKPFNSKSVTYTYIGYTEHNSRGQPIVRQYRIMQTVECFTIQRSPEINNNESMLELKCIRI